MKRLYRSRNNAILGGVAGGIAEYFGVDPTIVRLAWVIAGLMGGFGVAAYIIAWLIVPANPGQDSDSDWHWSERVRETLGEAAGGTKVHGGDGPRTFGLILVAVGVYLLARNFLPHLGLGRFWPVLLIAVGAWLVLAAVRGDR